MRLFISPGHAGMVGDQYMTRGKQSPEVPPGIYEGEFNRVVSKIVERTVRTLGKKDSTCLLPGPMSVSPTARAAFVNDYIRRSGDPAIFLAVHANASPKPGWSAAAGARVFVARNASSTSVAFAHQIMAEWSRREDNNEIGIRAPRQLKRANFTVLEKTMCPAVLIECGFMTNELDARYMATGHGRSAIAGVLACAYLDTLALQ